jgi:hypothetical protein
MERLPIATGYLTAEVSIRGLAEALVLAEVSVVAEAEAAAEADLVIGGRFEFRK